MTCTSPCPDADAMGLVLPGSELEVLLPSATACTQGMHTEWVAWAMCIDFEARGLPESCSAPRHTWR